MTSFPTMTLTTTGTTLTFSLQAAQAVFEIEIKSFYNEINFFDGKLEDLLKEAKTLLQDLSELSRDIVS